jgi:hypothetical protein
MLRVTILYEDSRDLKTKGFGLHALIKQCVCDVLGKSSWDIPDSELDGNPKNGVSKLRDECRRNMRRFAARSGVAFAVYDDDKIREEIGLPPIACKRDVVKELKDGCDSPDKLHVVLLQRNTESVLHALREIATSLATDSDWDEAINRKRTAQRDAIFNAAASPEPSRCLIRKNLRAMVPSFDRLIMHVARALEGPAA